MLIDINGPPNPPGFIGYPPPPMAQMPSMPPPPPTVTPFNYPSVCNLFLIYIFHYF